MRTRTLLLAASVVALTALLSHAGADSEQKLWNRMCIACHDGKTAPDSSALKAKYPSEEAFTEAVMAKGDRCMNLLKNDPRLITKIAREIGIEETGKGR